MAGQLIPPPELDLPMRDGTSAERIALWLGMLKFGEDMLIAGFRNRYGPDCDVRATFRRWYAAQMEEQDQKLERMMLRMSRASPGNVS
jgi:hypothetical protein